MILARSISSGSHFVGIAPPSATNTLDIIPLCGAFEALAFFVRSVSQVSYDSATEDPSAMGIKNIFHESPWVDHSDYSAPRLPKRSQ